MARKTRKKDTVDDRIDKALETGRNARGRKLSAVDRKILEKMRQARHADADDIADFGVEGFNSLMFRLTGPFAGRDVSGRRLDDDAPGTYLRMGLCACIGLWIVILSVGTVADMSEHSQVMDGFSAQAKQAQTELLDVQRFTKADPSKTSPNGQAAAGVKTKDTIESVTKIAGQVAALQNAYNNPGVTNDQMKAIAAKLRPFFTEDALKKGDLDPSTPWFSGYQVNDRGIVTADPMDPHTYGWVFPGSVDVSTTQGDISIVWLNRNRATGELYAWVKADFDPKEKKFHDLALGMTSEGRKHNGIISVEQAILSGEGGSEALYYPGIGQRPPELDHIDPNLPKTLEGWDKYMKEHRSTPPVDPNLKAVDGTIQGQSGRTATAIAPPVGSHAQPPAQPDAKPQPGTGDSGGQ